MVKSSVIKKGNHNAIWPKDSLVFENIGQHMIQLEIYDSNFTSDTFVGQGTHDFISIDSSSQQVIIHIHKEKNYLGTLIATLITHQ
jgi:hypothetical protein